MRPRKRLSTKRTDDGLVLVAFGLGANLGEAATTLGSAVHVLSQLLEQPRAAALYSSPALSAIPQPDFLNTALVGSTRLSPDWLLAITKSLEWRLGRRTGLRGSARSLDIDLLLYGDLVSKRLELRLPHPGLARRRFVLAPLAEIAPEIMVPAHGGTVAELLAKVRDSARVDRIE